MELREEIGMTKHPGEGGGGGIQRMSEERLTKRAWKTEETGRRRRGRPRLRWRDRVKRTLERALVNSRE